VRKEAHLVRLEKNVLKSKVHRRVGELGVVVVRRERRQLDLSEHSLERLPPFESLLDVPPAVCTELALKRRVADELVEFVGVHRRVLFGVEGVIDEDTGEEGGVAQRVAKLLRKRTGTSSDDRETHRHCFSDGNGDAFRHRREEEDVRRGEVGFGVFDGSEDADEVADVELADALFDLVLLVAVAEHDDNEVALLVVPDATKSVSNVGNESGTLLRVEATDDGDDGGLGRDVEEVLLRHRLHRSVVGREIADLDPELDDTDRRRVAVTTLDKPLAKVGGAGDGAGEVALSDERVGGVTSALPAVVSFVVEVLSRQRTSEKLGG
jgi:hypothetical protein